MGYVSAIRSPADLYFNWQPDSATPGATPIQTMSWSWENDDGSPPPNLSGWYGYNNIGVRISKSGTMSVVVRINGVLKTLKKHIYVGPIELGLRANPTVVADTGEAVTAVAFPVPEALASDKPPVTVEVLQWTFTDSITAAISQPCAAGVNPCVFNTGRSGTLKVRGKVAGVEKTAETKISAIKCKTGNPLLDSKRVRDRLKQMYDSAVTANRETKMYFYRNADGTYEGYWGTPGPQGSSLCGVDAVPPFPSTAALTLVGFAHVHLQGLGQWANCPGQIPQRIVVEGHHEKDFERIVWFDPKKGQSSAPDFGLESIVSDPNAIYRSYPPDLDPFNTQSGPMDWHNAQKKYSKQGGQCGW